MARMLLAAVVLATAAIYGLRLNDAAGLMVDDAWYVLLAKALADGRGYRLISSAAVEILPSYPPGLPALLSLVFRARPDFPGNVWMLKGVSILAMFGVGGLSYVYLHRHRGVQRDLAICAAVGITVTPAFVFLATSTVMSECVFTFSQLGAVVLLHRSLEVGESRRGWLLAVAAAIAAAATVLIRSAGIALVLAAVLWLVKERRWQKAALVVVVVAVCLLPWMLYARVHAPTAAERVAHGGAVVYGYADQFWMRWAGSPSFGRITAADLPARLGTNLVDVFGRDLGGILAPSLFRGASESGEEVVALGGRAGLSAAGMGGALETMVFSFLVGGVALLGYVRRTREGISVAEFLLPGSLAITLMWPFWSFRFVLPLTPFLYLYVLAGVDTLARGSTRAARVVMMCLIGLSLYDHAGYIVRARQPGSTADISWLADARRVNATLDWMGRGLDQNGVIAATNPALVFMRTGRKAIAFDDPAADSPALKSRGVRYVASLLPVDLPDRSQGDYKVRYLGARLWVIELD